MTDEKEIPLGEDAPIDETNIDEAEEAVEEEVEEAKEEIGGEEDES